MKKSFLTVFCLFLASCSIVSAHTSGQSIEILAGRYNIDVGYDAVQPVIEVAKPVNFDFLLRNVESSALEEFTKVWVVIHPSEAETYAEYLFSGYISPANGRTGFAFSFPLAGSYTMQVRYEKEGDLLAEASVPLKVQGRTVSNRSQTLGDDTGSQNLLLFASGLTGLFFGAALVRYFSHTS